MRDNLKKAIKNLEATVSATLAFIKEIELELKASIAKSLDLGNKLTPLRTQLDELNQKLTNSDELVNRTVANKKELVAEKGILIARIAELEAERDQLLKEHAQTIEVLTKSTDQLQQAIATQRNKPSGDDKTGDTNP